MAVTLPGVFSGNACFLHPENRMRLQQMEGAREHIDTLINSLQLRLNTLRQQEIVEEIEMILVGEQTGHAWGKIQGKGKGGGHCCLINSPDQFLRRNSN